MMTARIADRVKGGDVRMDQTIWDAAIIGGGPAGLNAALVLGRARRSVLVIDDERPRNRVTRATHGFLTRDGVPPGELRRFAREELHAYPAVHIASDTAVAVNGADGSFYIATAQGKMYSSRKLLFAVGKKDLPLRINGLREAYGTSAFVCPYCDGWELRDQPIVIIARGNQALHMAKLIAGWTNRYAICSNGPAELTVEQRMELWRHGVEVYESPIRQIVSRSGAVQQVVLMDGAIIPCAGIFFAPKLSAGSELPMALGCAVSPSGTLIVDANGKTSVPGIYSAGDSAHEHYQAIAAAATGSLAAVSLNTELLMESWERMRR